MIHCAKCQTVNPSELRYCQKCHRDLLPGEGFAARLSYLIAAGLVTALGVFILLQFSQGDPPEGLNCALTSPVFWGIVVLITPITGIWYALRRTPHYKRYLARAQRHTGLDPNQALADLDQAMGLAPAKEQAGILKKRAELYQKLGMQKEAARDRIEYMQSDDAHKNGAAIAGMIGLDSDIVENSLREGAQKTLLDAGEAVAVGYCHKCKNAVELDSKLHCKTHPRIRAQEVRLSIPDDLEKTRITLLNSHHENNRRLRSRRLVALAACVVICAASIYLINRMAPEPDTTQTNSSMVEMRATELDELEQTTVMDYDQAPDQEFHESDFHFHYPADWQLIHESDIDQLLSSSLKGMDENQILYLGGVYHDGLNNCSGCAQIVILAIKDPALTGTLTDEQFEAAKQANQEIMGDRLLEYNLTKVSAFPATESKHIGRSGDSQLWELIIVPPTQGLVYLFSMSSAKEDYATFEPQFQAALDSLEIGNQKDQSARVQSTAAFTATETVDLIATVLKETINLRAGPGPSYAIVDNRVKGEEIPITGRNESEDWLCTSLENGDEAWVYRPLVSLAGDVQELPVEILDE